jgi:dTDP-4-amino-4,6-dideoxygalactose transaminase/lipopolysaccharide/colanic/teichoic acid biosynthesis glycosyltransferase
MIKRIFDFTSAFFGLIILSPLLIIVSIIIKITSRGAIFYKQERTGRNAEIFTIIKFRSMVENHGDNNTVTVSGDQRITRFGAFIRKYKIDELPALWNVIKGEMSLVGPRPDLPYYYSLLKGEDRKILELKPGVTGPASLKYANEEQILKLQDNPEQYHYDVIFKDKVKINLAYYYKNDLWIDLKIILSTIFRLSYTVKEKKKIQLSPPDFDGNELAFIKKNFNIDWIASFGPHINSFEKNLSLISKGKNVAALSSGTAAIHMALILLGVKENDTILCSSFTFSASANPIKYVGANPIFIDSEKEGWNMCPELLEKAIVDGIALENKPKAIMLVHLYGMPAKMDEIMCVAKKYDVPVIEDAAEALGSTYKNQQLGTFGKFGIYSFNGNKIITTSGGGALICEDEKLIVKAKFLATQARDKAPHYEHSQIGYNYRMSNVCAAIGIGQLEVLSDRVKQKRAIHTYYKNELSSLEEISFLEENEDSFSNYWLTTILLDESSTIDREQLRLHLEKDNIECRPLWKPMHLQPIFEECKSYVNGISEDLFNRGLCLPSGTNMTKEDLERVVNRIKELYEA